MTNQLDGTWELVSGQPLPKGARDIKILSGGHFIFAAYDTETGKPLYAAGLIGRDQSFTLEVDGDTFTQTGTLSNGKPLSERWKRIG
jgi:hypothetical protein